MTHEQVIAMFSQSGSEQRLVIDKIDGDWATLEVEAGVTLDVPAAWLPAEAAEGQVLLVSAERNDTSSTVTVTIDEADTERTRDRVRSKLDQLRGRE